MAERLYVGSRKGLFELARRNGAWDIVDAHFLGDPVSAVLADRDGLYAGLDLGHCRGQTVAAGGAGPWRELPAPAFPPKPEDAADDPHPWSLGKIWASSRAACRAGCGPARCPAGCSARTMAARAGR